MVLGVAGLTREKYTGNYTLELLLETCWWRLENIAPGSRAPGLSLELSDNKMLIIIEQNLLSN